MTPFVQDNLQYDTANLRHAASYCVAVADDVYWVPVNILGRSRYTNAQIASILTCTPQEKREKIGTLYEAIQLYQIGKFRGVLDNIAVGDLAQNLHLHKPGYHAVRTNEGCCAANSNWLAYLLRGKYDQVGFINYSQRDKNGHIINFIYHDGWYYFIDMMMYRQDSVPFAGIEAGTDEGYNRAASISGHFFRSRTPHSYVSFCLKNHADPPVLFTLSLEDELRALAAQGEPGRFDILHPQGTKLVVLYKEPKYDLKVRFMDVSADDYEAQWAAIRTDAFPS